MAAALVEELRFDPRLFDLGADNNQLNRWLSTGSFGFGAIIFISMANLGLIKNQCR